MSSSREAERSGKASNGSSKPAATSAVPPPCDLAAEAAVLSAVMLKREVLDVVRDELTVDDFFSFGHRAVFEAILALDAIDREFDVVTVAHQLEAMERLRQIGGTAFLAMLTDATPSVANVAHHAQIVRKLGQLRRVKDTLERLAITARMAETRLDVDGFLDHCEKEVLGATHAETNKATAVGIAEMMATAIGNLTKPRAQQKRRGVTTGLIALDEISMGLIPGELWYVGARPGVGKTSLALGFVEVAAAHGHGAVMFSMEMKEPELSERLLISSAGVHGKRLQLGELDEAELTQVMGAGAKIARYPMRFDFTPALTPSALRARLRRHVASIRAKTPAAKLALVVVDYVQLMAADRRSKQGNRNEEITEISRSLKLLASEFDCALVALSQLRRPDPRAPFKRPTKDDLRDSGALEADADKILMIHRAPDGDPDSNGEAELILDKGRNTGGGKARVTWVPWCARFENRTQTAFAFTGGGEGTPPDDDEP